MNPTKVQLDQRRKLANAFLDLFLQCECMGVTIREWIVLDCCPREEEMAVRASYYRDEKDFGIHAQFGGRTAIEVVHKIREWKTKATTESEVL
jgi:hypothetical protein